MASYQKGSWKETNRRYTIRWRIRDANSKSGWASRMRTLPAGTTKKQMLAELDAEAKRANDTNNRPQPILDVGLTFKQFTDGPWTRHLDSNNRRPATRATYESLLKTWLLPRFGDLPLTGITVAMMTALFDDLKGQRAAATGALVYALLSNMFKVAEDHELIVSIPLKVKRHRPKLKKAKKPAYPPDVIRQIVLAADPQYRAILWTYALTGLRAGEVPALQWQDIDFDAGLIHVRRKLWRQYVQDLKTDASHAPVGLPPILADVLADHKASSRWAQPDDFVFVMPDGRPFTQQTLGEKLRLALARAGVPYERHKTGFGLFRRSLATYIMKQMGLMQAQMQLRHGSAATTARAYVCRDESVVQDNTAAIEAAFLIEPVSNAVQ
jgi:integrase